MRRHRIEFLSEVIFHKSGERFFRPVGELLQIFWKGADMLIVLLRIQLKRLAGKRAFRPSLIERVLQKVILLDESIERFEHGRFFCAVLGHLSFLIFPFFESGRISKRRDVT